MPPPDEVHTGAGRGRRRAMRHHEHDPIARELAQGPQQDRLAEWIERSRWLVKEQHLELA